MNKIVFLDIDGVLNTQGDNNLIENTFEEIKLNNLVKLVKDTNSELVIISDRRLLSEERIMIDGVFDEYEILVNYLSLERTHRKRSDEVLFYLSNHECQNYVILDDNDLGYSDDIVLKSHFINTYENGFTNKEYIEALTILDIKPNYLLVIDNMIIGTFSFSAAKEKALKIIHDHILNEAQAYAYELPFSVGSGMSYMYDERILSDEEIIIFERIRMLIQDLISFSDSINKPIDYIKKSYECHRSLDGVNYDIHILRKHNEIILSVSSDDDYFQTNMFNMEEVRKYYFKSRQEIVVIDEKSKRALGEIVKINIFLIPVEENLDTMRKIMKECEESLDLYLKKVEFKE